MRDGGLIKLTSEEGTGRGMDGGREEASGGGIARGREGAREGNFKGCILRKALTSTVYTVFTNHPTTRPLPSILCYFK